MLRTLTCQRSYEEQDTKYLRLRVSCHPTHIDRRRVLNIPSLNRSRKSRQESRDNEEKERKDDAKPMPRHSRFGRLTELIRSTSHLCSEPFVTDDRPPHLSGTHWSLLFARTKTLYSRYSFQLMSRGLIINDTLRKLLLHSDLSAYSSLPRASSFGIDTYLVRKCPFWFWMPSHVT